MMYVVFTTTVDYFKVINKFEQLVVIDLYYICQDIDVVAVSGVHGQVIYKQLY
jgi:hypothetical protein